MSAKRKNKFNMYTFTYKYKKTIVGAISILLVLCMVAGIFIQFMY